MSHHPDADAFVRAILDNPAEVTTRLAFADWLVETGDPANVDWGNYVRLMTEADTHPNGSFEWENFRWRAANLPTGIRATLEVDADLFVAHTQPLLRLLPAHRFRVALDQFTPHPPALDAVSVLSAFFSRILPLAVRDDVLILAVRDPEDWDAVRSLEFSLGRELLAAGAEGNDLVQAIKRHYGRSEADDLQPFLTEFTETTAEFRQPPPPPRPPVPDPPFFRLSLAAPA